MTTSSTLRPEQRTALLAYAAENGRNWKSKLAIDWSNANARIGGEVSSELQQVRNTLGPAWLRRTTLAQIEASGVGVCAECGAPVSDVEMGCAPWENETNAVRVLCIACENAEEVAGEDERVAEAARAEERCRSRGA